MQARVDGVIEKVRAIHRAAEDRGAEAAALGGECSEKDRRKAAEDADVVIVSHGHFSRVLIACVPSPARVVHPSCARLFSGLRLTSSAPSPRTHAAGGAASRSRPAPTSRPTPEDSRSSATSTA